MWCMPLRLWFCKPFSKIQVYYCDTHIEVLIVGSSFKRGHICFYSKASIKICGWDYYPPKFWLKVFLLWKLEMTWKPFQKYMKNYFALIHRRVWLEKILLGKIYVLFKNPLYENLWVSLCFTQDVAKGLAVEMEKDGVWWFWEKCTLCLSTYVDQPYPVRPHYPPHGKGA